MNSNSRQSLVRRLDLLFFVGLLTTSGLAALLFFTQFFQDQDETSAARVVSATPAVLATEAVSVEASATPAPIVITATPQNTLAPSSTVPPSATLSVTPDLTATWLYEYYLTQSIVSPTSPADLTATAQQLAQFTQAAAAPALTGTAQRAAELTEAAALPEPSSTPPPGETPIRRPPASVTPSPAALAQAATEQTEEAAPVVTEAPEATTTFTPYPTMTASPEAPTPTTEALEPTLTFTPYPTLESSPAPAEQSAQGEATLTFTPYPAQQSSAAATEELPAATEAVTESSLSPVPPASFTPAPTSGAAQSSAAQEAAESASATPLPTLQSGTPPAASVARPRIDTPANGAVLSPGKITVAGQAAPGLKVELWNQGTGRVLATIQAPPGGRWQTTVTLPGEGRVTLVASVPGADGTPIFSDPVTITLAPAVQPTTGGSLDETGRAFSALLALLLAAAGFSAYFAARLLYLLAHDRLKPR